MVNLIKERIAKIIRVLSVPPIMVSIFILILAFNKNNIFRNSEEIIIMIVFLGLVPALAYVLSGIIPAVRSKGREGQRKLAFVTNLVGYGIALLWAILTNVSKELLLICLTYFLSVVFLAIYNKGFHFRASGHASGFTGPLILMIYFLGWKVIAPVLIIAALIVWASLYLKRHTIKELAGGILVNILAFIISVMIITVL